MDTGAATPAGRFAPSPTADLHIGNLRTAVLAGLFARSTGRRFLIRVEDLDDLLRGQPVRGRGERGRSQDEGRCCGREDETLHRILQGAMMARRT